ncbi:MAG: hypothetical protein R6X32_08775 [Chloroflexota bacterium]|jgi:hypothetical protein
MKQNKPKLRYFSCLLRLWETEADGQIVWRVLLEYPATGQRRGFASLAELFVFLEEETAAMDAVRTEK